MKILNYNLDILKYYLKSNIFVLAHLLKLFVYPFSYVGVDNSTGITATFRYEDFINATPKFYIGGALGQGCSVKLCPVSYKNRGENIEVFDYGVVGAKYPVCAWAKDYYTNWVTQNAVNMGSDITKGLISTAGNLMFGNTIGAAGSLVGTIGGLLGQVHQAQHHPDQAAGDVNSSDLLMGWQRYYNKFFHKKTSLKGSFFFFNSLLSLTLLMSGSLSYILIKSIIFC